MKRNYNLDIVKFFAIFFVVCIHVQPFSNLHSVNANWSVVTDLIVTFARFAVPFFFVVSGYLLSEKIKTVENKNQHFTKYIKKNAKLYFSWLLFYLVFDFTLIALQSYFKGLNLTIELLDYLSQYSIWKVFYFGTDTTAYPLWFLLALLWSVVLISFFYKANKIGILLILSLVLNLIGQFGQSYSGLLHLPVDTKDAFFFGLFYTTLGFYISKNYEYIKTKIKLSDKQLALLLFVFSITQIIERFILVEYFGGNGGNYYLSTIPLTIILLLLVLQASIAIKSKFMINIGKNAVGIFVSHNFILTIISTSVTFIGLDFIKETIIWNILFTPFVFITSYYFYSTVQIYKGKFKSILKKNKVIAET